MVKRVRELVRAEDSVETMSYKKRSSYGENVYFKTV